MSTVAQALRSASERLSEISDTARIDAELLMAHALGVSRSDMLLSHSDEAVPAEFDALIARRATHEPVAHIIGHQEFYGRQFIVSPDVLIPRGDSEVLIDAALELAPDAKRILDLGTGSGCLLLTVLAELPVAEGIGVDASESAAEIAKQNAARLGVVDRAQVLLRDWNELGWADDLGQFDLILSNPPYVEANAPLDPDVRDFEPAQALFAGADGLDDYNVIIPQLRGMMADGALALLEIGSTQGDAVSEIARKNGFAVEIRPDLAGRARVAILT